MWQQWLNVLLGVWTLVTPFLGLSAATLTWVLAITGLVIAALALWGAGDESLEREHMAELEYRVQHRAG